MFMSHSKVCVAGVHASLHRVLLLCWWWPRLSLPWILSPLCLTSLRCCSADTWSPATTRRGGVRRGSGGGEDGVSGEQGIGLGIREQLQAFISS